MNRRFLFCSTAAFGSVLAIASCRTRQEGPALSDGQGPKTITINLPDSGTRRVMRGGSWWSHALHLRSADRPGIPPDNSEYTYIIGLRLVRLYP